MNYSIIDNFISQESVRAINEQWPTEWEMEDGSFQLKWSTSVLPPAAMEVFNWLYSEPNVVGDSLGIPDLFADPELFGAGLHCIPRGGFLNMHIDFNQHPMGWHRRANCLIYLNEDWDESWGGDLYLGEDKGVKVAPIAGRAVMFECTEDSWHGHPEKLQCPDGRQRRSLAIYFYTKNPPEAEPHSTVYKKK